MPRANHRDSEPEADWRTVSLRAIVPAPGLQPETGGNDIKGIFTLAAALLACLPLLGPAQTACAGEWTPETVAALKTQAEAGNAEAQYSLGMLHDEGEGVPQDYAEARRWLEKAALQGHAEAQCNLGILYYKGQGVRQNYAEARRWLEKAAAQGVAVAQYNLGVMYHGGQSVRQNYAEARRWFEKAAAQGDADAQFNLGAMYLNGDGVRQDKKTAKEWLGKACDNGCQSGCDEYRKLNEAGF